MVLSPKQFFLLSSLSVILFSGCSHDSRFISHKLPLMSHAHIGHALTAWRATPGEQGLFVVAENEIQQALDETRLAKTPGRTKTEIHQYLSKVLLKLEPSPASNIGEISNSNYGAIKALKDANDHMIYAAESPDATENMKQIVNEFVEGQEVVKNEMVLAIEITKLTQQSDGTEQQALLNELENSLLSALNGEDLDQDGQIGSSQDEYGMLQIREIISNGLQKESPPYHPVGKKYLFGLVRLPDGNWAYQFDNTNDRSANRVSVGGY